MNQEQLLIQIEGLEEEAATYRRQGNDTKYNEKMTEANQLRQQLTDMKVENKVAEAQAQVTQSFDSITVGDQTVTLAELAANEPARQILYAWFTQYETQRTEVDAKQHASELALLKSSYDGQLNELNDELKSSQDKYDALYEQSNDIRIKNAQLQASLDDMTARRDAAANELADANKEIDRLNSQVDDLRTEIAVGAKAAVQVVSTVANTGGPDMRELIAQFNAAKPAIYDLVFIDLKKSTYTAKLAETGETITFNYLEKGKYREVSPEEAARFRADAEAAAAAQAAEAAEPVQADPAPDLPLGDSVTPPPFPDSQTEISNDDNAMAGQPVDGTVATEAPVTRSEFEALKRDVEALKQARVGAAA